MTVTIVENSWLAKIAAWKLETNRVAMVIGTKIYLCNCTKAEFLRNKKWVRHEIVHVRQWKRYGFIRFAFLYLLESFNKGYLHNKYEIEARNKENDPLVLKGVEIV
jgi:hypothetical protein